MRSARTTRSATRAARVTEAVATGPLGALSHDELGVIFDGLANPLQPDVAVALSSVCLGLRTPLEAPLVLLEKEHSKARALCKKTDMTCEELRTVRTVGRVEWTSKGLNVEDLTTLGTLLDKWLPQIRDLNLRFCDNGDECIQGLCEGLGRSSSSVSIVRLHLHSSGIGSAGAGALAATFLRGALPMLEYLDLSFNPLGNQGVAALAAPLRRLLRLTKLILVKCEIGDDGIKSLFGGVDKEDFKALRMFLLGWNRITDTGCAFLVTIIFNRLTSLTKHGRINPSNVVEFIEMLIGGNPASKESQIAVANAVAEKFQSFHASNQQSSEGGEN